MPAEEKIAIEDKDITYQKYFDKMQCEYLKTLVSNDVIDEHAKNSLGQHSEPLSRLLHYFRSAPQKNKYVIKRDDENNLYEIYALSGVRGEPPHAIENIKFKTLDEAYHGVFLQCISDLLDS